MKHIVVGTAGHIDHGKTTLVRALTGIDTDRLQEEKRRGISIDLGFAHLKLSDSLRVAFIDVPGHEKFIKNMLAGVGGIDAVMLVIAADESIKPQTREHFDICRLLRIPRGIVALTRTDIADPELVELARMEVEEFVSGSFLERAPIIPVSAVSGAGLPELSEALRRIACETTRRPMDRSFRFPVDRSFVMQGFGTVATGTVISGAVDVDAELDVFPVGRRVRVRGIQTHGARVQTAAAGQRAALNLTGVEVGELGRGSVLAVPGSFRMSGVVDCMLEVLPSAKPVKNRAPVHFHSGTSETVAEVRLLIRKDTAVPGEITPARLFLREPLLLVAGDRFVIRKFSPLVTIGGGEVVDPFPQGRVRAGTAQHVVQFADASLPDKISILVAQSPGGLSGEELAIRTGFASAAIDAAAPRGVRAVREPVSWFVDEKWIHATAESWRHTLSEFHRANRLLPGIRREELRTRELPGLPAFIFDLVIAASPALRCTADVVHLASHRIALQQDEEKALQSIEKAFEQSGLEVPGLKSVLDSSGVDPGRARTLLQVLLRSNRLIRVTEDLIFHPTAVNSLRMLLGERRGSRFGVTEFKEWTGISRKYAIPLLEYLDRERVTRREGDQRLIL